MNPTTLNAKPNPFSNYLKLELSSQTEQDVIVRMTNQVGQICKMIGWKLMAGQNIAVIHELENLEPGYYYLDILDMDGQNLLHRDLTKEA